MLVVAVPLNLIFDRLNLTADMTPNSMYSLTRTTTDYLDELDQRGVVVDVYFLTEMAELEGDLELLALYRTLQNYDAHPCFNLIDFDPDTDPEQLRKLNSENQYNLSSGDFLFTATWSSVCRAICSIPTARMPMIMLHRRSSAAKTSSPVT